jgi:hypothetical protein
MSTPETPGATKYTANQLLDSMMKISTGSGWPA